MRAFLNIPCPTVREGDAASYLLRARWRLEDRFHRRGDAKPDLLQAIALDPTLWEPWTLLADQAWGDAALRLRCFEEAIRRGDGGETKHKRAQLLLWLDRFEEAEREYTRIIDATTSDSIAAMFAFRDRSLARVQLGDYDGAVSDMLTPELGWASFHTRELLGRFQWIKGDFAGAYQTFTAEKRDRLEFFRIWSHLCQIGHGVRHSTMPPIWSGEKAPVRIAGVRVSADQSYEGGCDIGPPQPTVWIWDLLTDLFLDRTTPDCVLVAAQSTLATSDAWRFPETAEGTRVYDFDRPIMEVWRSELLFYCGMWHLSKGDEERARQALSEAAGSDMSRTLEKIAAREQLRRLDEAAASGPPARPVRPLEAAPPPPPSPDLYRFIDMDLTRPTRAAAKHAPVLKFGTRDLGDQGLATLLSSPNMKHITHLDLHDNNITAAGMAAFRSSPFLSNIKELNLADNPIGDEGLKQLLNCAGLSALRSLDVSNTELTDTGALLLVHQTRFHFQQLSLGDRPLDMAVWLQLAHRFGDGLFARGTFHSPYKPPFDPKLVVSFSSPIVRESPLSRPFIPDLNEADVPRCELRFRMVDYVQWRLQGLAYKRHQASPTPLLEDLCEVRELELKCAAWGSDVYPIDGRDGRNGLTMAGGGFDPISLRCPDCTETYVRPHSRVGRIPDRNPSRLTCPEGHVLRQEQEY